MESKPSKKHGSTSDRLRSTYRYLMGKRDVQGVDTIDMSDKVRDTIVSFKARHEILNQLEYTFRMGLSIGKLSEASLHIKQNQYLVTRKNCSFAHILDNDLLLVSSGSVLNTSQIPKYWAWHQVIYETSSQVEAILLGQPVAAMAMAATGNIPKDALLKDASEVVGQLAICSPKESSLSLAVKSARVLLVPGVGVISCSRTLQQAVENLAIADRWCEISLMTDT